VIPRLQRALALARDLGAEGVLAAHPATVTWLTGLEADAEGGPSPFALLPLAVVTPDGAPTIVASEDEADAVARAGCELAGYSGFTTGRLDPVAGAVGALAEVVGRRKLVSELGVLPASLARDLALVDGTVELARARAVKDPDELDRIRKAIQLCDAGQREARARAEAGMTELELWGLVRAAVEEEAGRRTPLLADLVAGQRTGTTGGAPGERPLAAGDLVLCDLVPRRAGYWGDSCATFAVGEPSDTARAKHRLAREALARGLDAVRPGVVAGRLDQIVRAGLDYPHHTGHGLGTSWHEEPRIVPGGTTVLEPGMVLALEPAVYDKDEGVRVEQVIVVRGDGVELLSRHGLGL
jgi:Xaa-Pro dipeptidase